MKIAANKAESFLRNPDPSARAILVYGPDTGLVRERIDQMAKSVCPDLSDPFRVADLTPAILRDDPARLADEAAALALTGGRRVVRVREAADSLTALFKGFLADPAGDALILVEAGELGPRSTLRKLFEEAANAAALPSYADEGSSLDGVIRETLKRHGLTIDPDAQSFLADHLGGDRRLTRAELEKLALYMGGPGTVTLADAAACIGDTAAFGMEDVAMAAAEGDQKTLQRLLDRLALEGTSPIAILRTVTRHFLRLHLAAGHMAKGKTSDQALASLKPPPIFKVAPRMKGQLQRWPAERLSTALGLLLNAEMECKTTGLPAEALCGRVLMQIARVAAAAGQRR
ncbi:DNA polymerase III subunit delta [Telmatospirillum sp. J64-1]|uniref:DNA polymerase III subunit delta n=1 Tax=Telmatospirillum sp. J64-1 TaxID=2502183 RepID=UPI00115EB3B7|nr:DNA polymerase III subunit delta [Telmatospirillum sp. J64-1]